MHEKPDRDWGFVKIGCDQHPMPIPFHKALFLGADEDRWLDWKFERSSAALNKGSGLKFTQMSLGDLRQLDASLNMTAATTGFVAIRTTSFSGIGEVFLATAAERLAAAMFG
ncbi:hypothetical protein PG997_014156 [Apiospora hydei]|uniref:Uncharacterized protein n=1 Tax=Apiospora hydei TaxID=1337664 RepID=A0ABR1UW37_9PEZI